MVDEVGFEPMTREDSSLYFRLVGYRCLRGNTVITTNKSVKDRPGIFAGDEALATALLGRLLHKNEASSIRGRCYRLPGLERLGRHPENLTGRWATTVRRWVFRYTREVGPDRLGAALLRGR